MKKFFFSDDESQNNDVDVIALKKYYDEHEEEISKSIIDILSNHLEECDVDFDFNVSFRDGKMQEDKSKKHVTVRYNLKDNYNILDDYIKLVDSSDTNKQSCFYDSLETANKTLSKKLSSNFAKSGIQKALKNKMFGEKANININYLKIDDLYFVNTSIDQGLENCIITIGRSQNKIDKSVYMNTKDIVTVVSECMKSNKINENEAIVKLNLENPQFAQNFITSIKAEKTEANINLILSLKIG